MTTESTRYVKRIQSWVNPQLKAQGLSGCSYDQIREVYLDQSIVSDPENPTTEEFMQARELVYLRMTSKTSEEQTVEIENEVVMEPKLEDCHQMEPIAFSSLVPFTEEVSNKSEETKSRSEVYDSVQSAINLVDEWLSDESGYDEQAYPEIEKALIENRVIDQPNDLSHDHTDDPNEDTDSGRGSGSLIITENNNIPSVYSSDDESIVNVRSIVEQQFTSERMEVQEAIIEYAEQKAFRNAQELQDALIDINNTELSVLMKVANDYLKQRDHNQRTVEQHLQTITESDQKKSQVRATRGYQRMSQFKNQFGVLS